MVYAAGTELKRPDNYAVFETNCLKLGKKMINATTMNKNGRRGQPQKGVDVWGWRDDDVDQIVGIQCKQKGFGQILEEWEVIEEWEQALTFNPTIKEFFILTTADNDVKVEQLARELCARLRRSEGRSVPFHVWGWGRICDELIDYPELIKVFDPDYGIYSQQHAEKLDIVAGKQDRHDVKLDAVMAEVRSTKLLLLGVDDGSSTSEVDKVLDNQIDGYRSILRDNRPATALSLFEKLLSEVELSSSERIKFRIKANLGACQIEMGDIEKGCDLLLEAYEHAPSEPKAISNRALAYLLKDDFEAVRKIGEEQFSVDIADDSLWSHVIQAASKLGHEGDPLSLVPERHRKSEGALVAEVHFYRVRGDDIWRRKAAYAVALFPSGRYARQFFADASLEEVGRGQDRWTTGMVPTALRGRVEAAAETYQDLWKEASAGENVVGSDEFVVLANLFVAMHLLARHSDILELIEKERSHIERDQGTLIRAAIAAFEAGSDLTNDLLPLLDEGSAKSMLKLQLALRRGDWLEIAGFDTTFADEVDEMERLICRTAIDICQVWKAAGGFPAPADLEAPVAAAAGDPRASILAADLCKAFGADDVADQAWQNGRRSLDAASHWTARLSVARHAFQRNRWRDAADLYIGAIDHTLDSEELRQLAVAAACEIPQTGRGARFFRELPSKLLSIPFFAHFEAVMFFNSGDMPKAEKSARLVLKRARRLDTFNLLATVMQRRGRPDRIKEFLRTHGVLLYDGSIHEKVVACRILHRAGRVPEALGELYQLYLANRDRPDLTLAFFILMMDRASFKHVPKPVVVGLDVWVRAEDDSGHVFEFTVGDAVSTAERILPETHPFAAQALGKKAGETFSIRRDVGGEVTWTVKEFRHRWVQAARDIGQYFETHFPDQNGVYSYTIKDNDIQPMLDVVKQAAEANKQLACQYSDGVPLSFVSGRIDRDPVGLAEYIRSLGEDIRTCVGTAVEREHAFDVIRRHRVSGAVLDTYTAWTAATLDLLPALKALFGTLVIPQSVIDDLVLLAGVEKPSGKEFSIIYREGQFLKHEVTREQALQRRRHIDEQKAKIENSCEIVAIAAPEISGDDADERKEWLDFAIENCGAGALDPAAIGANGYVLLSEDMNYRVVAKSIWTLDAVWLQPSLAAATALGLIPFPEYAAKLVKLAQLRHGFISFDHSILLQVLGTGSEAELAGFIAAADFIGTPSADLNSHVDVAVRFIDAVIVMKSVAYLSRHKAISILLGKLVRNSPLQYPKILAAVVHRCSEPGQVAVAQWVQGHFMVPQVEDAYQELVGRLSLLWQRQGFDIKPSLIGNLLALRSYAGSSRMPKAIESS